MRYVHKNRSIPRPKLCKNFRRSQQLRRSEKKSAWWKGAKIMVCSLLCIPLLTTLFSIALYGVFRCLQLLHKHAPVLATGARVEGEKVKRVVMRMLSRNRNRRVAIGCKHWGPSEAVRLRLNALNALMAHPNDLDLSSAILLDTGCSQHTFFDQSKFTNFRRFNPSERHLVHGIGDTILQAMGEGDVVLNTVVDGRHQRLNLDKVLYCPDMNANLLSGSRLIEKNGEITLRTNGGTVKDFSGKVMLQCNQISNLYVVKTWEDYNIAMAAYAGSKDPIEQLWHERLGHISMQRLKTLEKMSSNLDLTKDVEIGSICEACVTSKLRDTTHRDQIAAAASHPYHTVFSDVCGPMRTTGYDGSRYFVTFLDAYSKESEVYCIKYKSEVPSMFRRYKATKERSAEGIRIRRLHSDGGGEYLSHDFHQDLQEEGIRWTYSVPASQQQNGAAERLNQTILNLAQPLIQKAELDSKY